MSYQAFLNKNKMFLSYAVIIKIICINMYIVAFTSLSRVKCAVCDHLSVNQHLAKCQRPQVRSTRSGPSLLNMLNLESLLKIDFRPLGRSQTEVGASSAYSSSFVLKPVIYWKHSRATRW